jgi:diacylglycerol kinase family enzyme
LARKRKQDDALAELLAAAYLLTGATNIQAIKAKQARFESPEKSWEGEFLAMAVGNARYAGGAVDMCPNAKLDDGLLEVTIMPDVPEQGMGQVLTDLLQTGFVEGIRLHLQTWRTDAVKIYASETMQFNLDGEPLAGTDISFDILPGAMNCHPPEHSPLPS